MKEEFYFYYGTHYEFLSVFVCPTVLARSLRPPRRNSRDKQVCARRMRVYDSHIHAQSDVGRNAHSSVTTRGRRHVSV